MSRGIWATPEDTRWPSPLLDLDFRLKPDFVKATLELAGEA